MSSYSLLSCFGLSARQGCDLYSGLFANKNSSSSKNNNVYWFIKKNKKIKDNMARIFVRYKSSILNPLFTTSFHYFFWVLRKKILVWNHWRKEIHASYDRTKHGIKYSFDFDFLFSGASPIFLIFYLQNLWEVNVICSISLFSPR